MGLVNIWDEIKFLIEQGIIKHGCRNALLSDGTLALLRTMVIHNQEDYVEFARDRFHKIG